MEESREEEKKVRLLSHHWVKETQATSFSLLTTSEKKF